MSDSFFGQVKKGLIVSCQALEDEPLHGADVMAKMAKAAEIGGARAIRANGAADIVAIKNTVHLPVIGLIKRNYPDSEVYITPTLMEVKELIEAGVDVIALDATNRLRPNGESFEELVKYIQNHGVKVMADTSTLEEALMAEALHVDCISTTLSGYTSYTEREQYGPDFQLIKEVYDAVKIPVIAEGQFHLPSQVTEALCLGAHAVVVGSAITRPQLITEMYVSEIKKMKEKTQN
ncbi:N-acetylmannosamine-6-phosphate 2-epimerase [Neobacillus niacini]|uniref:N-acetylmannosamine-6-phosphate 2-epimerase n=1 Tax=Neobacillus niacini TaxID=86668 RepID=UPI0005F09A29|nr:N-acetylmannosamine-6-phosphate 2-epimerase [Neobacillus niacini]